MYGLDRGDLYQGHILGGFGPPRSLRGRQKKGRERREKRKKRGKREKEKERRRKKEKR